MSVPVVLGVWALATVCQIEGNFNIRFQLDYFFIYMFVVLSVAEWHEPNCEELSSFPYFEYIEIDEQNHCVPKRIIV